jgi:hypothetical protein
VVYGLQSGRGAPPENEGKDRYIYTRIFAHSNSKLLTYVYVTAVRFPAVMNTDRMLNLTSLKEKISFRDKLVIHVSTQECHKK